MHLRTTRDATTEHGFTLVELVVAMIMVAILLAIGSTVIVRAVQQEKKGQQQRQAIDIARKTVRMLNSDLSAAVAPDRSSSVIADGDDLTGVLVGGKFLQKADPSGTQLTIDPRDIVAATPNSLMFRADVSPLPGAECVRYRLIDPRAISQTSITLPGNANVPAETYEMPSVVREVFSYNSFAATCNTDESAASLISRESLAQQRDVM